MQVLFSTRAEAELRAAEDYHTDPNAADRFSWNVERLLLRMQRFPGSAQPRPDLTSRRDVRFWFVSPFFFVTQRQQEFLLVLTVAHASRDLRTLLHEVD